MKIAWGILLGLWLALGVIGGLEAWRYRQVGEMLNDAAAALKATKTAYVQELNYRKHISLPACARRQPVKRCQGWLFPGLGELRNQAMGGG